MGRSATSSPSTFALPLSSLRFADRGNDVTNEAADDKTPPDDGAGEAETPSKSSVHQANVAGVNPDAG